MSAFSAALPVKRSGGAADGLRRRVSRVLAALVVACAALSMGFVASASASTSNLTIVPAYDSSVSALPNFPAIQTAINTDVTNTEALITTRQPMTVTITLFNDPSGLGSSGAGFAPDPYSSYLAALQANPTKSGLQSAAIATMPVGPSTGINGATQVNATAADLTELGSSLGPVTGSISVNFALTDPARPNGAGLYDLQAVVQHEMDEILGIGGDGSTLGAGQPNDTPAPTLVGPLDFFRYHAPGVRSFTFSTHTTSYFSITSGKKSLTPFNQQNGPGTDSADWAVTSVPQVQDNSLSPGETPNLGRNELIAFEVVGYNLTPAGQQLVESTESKTFAPATAPLSAKTL